MSETVPIRELWYINPKKLLNRLIAATTWLPNMDTEPVSHTEVWEPGKNGNFIEITYTPRYGDIPPHDPGIIYLGQCWTSTTRGDANGTVVRPASEVLDHPENWLYTEHEVDYGHFLHARDNATRRVARNKGYSWRDLGRYIMPLWFLKGTGLADNGREICSEHVETWNVDMGVLDEKLLRSPRRLCKAIVLKTGSPLRRLVDGVVVRDGQWVKKNGIDA